MSEERRDEEVRNWWEWEIRASQSDPEEDNREPTEVEGEEIIE